MRCSLCQLRSGRGHNSPGFRSFWALPVGEEEEEDKEEEKAPDTVLFVPFVCGSLFLCLCVAVDSSNIFKESILVACVLFSRISTWWWTWILRSAFLLVFAWKPGHYTSPSLRSARSWCLGRQRSARLQHLLPYSTVVAWFPSGYMYLRQSTTFPRAPATRQSLGGVCVA